MIKSMTGFASLARDDDKAGVTVTIRAVNHRFLDLQIRLPPSLGELEARVRSLVQRRMARGRVEVTIAVQLRQAPASHVELQQEFVQALAAAVELARERGLVSGVLTPGDLVRMPQAFVIRERTSDDAAVLNEALAAVVEEATSAAIDDLDRMRVREGQHLADDLDARRRAIGEFVDAVVTAAANGRRDLEARLTERVRELTVSLPADPVAVAQEIVRVAQRSDIAEEVTRLRGHLSHWLSLVAAPEPCGRKLDFLLQELNREVNTIGSKADGLRVTELVIQAKAELERMREQVQNVE